MQNRFDVEGVPKIAPRDIVVPGCGGRVRVEALLDSGVGSGYVDQIVTAAGWAKTVRCQGARLIFIELNDGSCVKNLQIVVERAQFDDAAMKLVSKATTSTSLRVTGKIVVSPKDQKSYEMQVSDPAQHSVTIVGTCDGAKYPLAKKHHSLEFLRGIQHLRPRSYFIGATARIRSALAMATHEFFQNRGFQYIHTPLITAADCEGAGEMFQVTTLIPDNDLLEGLPTKKGTTDAAPRPIDYSKDFFGKKAFLTVSGQLAVENYCCALSDVYTFGPTFRAENSHTSRHLAEFWMIEPELAFADIRENMECAEAYLRYCVQYVLERNLQDLEYFQKTTEEGLIERLKNIAQSRFGRCTYTEAIELLEKVKDQFEEKNIHWGMDLGSEHERYLAEQHFKRPVIVYNYPYELKAFYMKLNEDEKTVAAMDVLVPKVGEVIGGSQREENLDVLDKQIADKGLEKESYWWYRELRMYGSVPHSGFGLGFERLIMLVTGIENIRDVIPFPRYPGTCEF